MKLTYDPQHNLAYLKLRENLAEVTTLHISDELNIDLAPDGAISGIEFLNANEQLIGRHSGLLEFINQLSGRSETIKLNG